MGDLGSIPGLGRLPGEGNGYPLQCSGLKDSMDCVVRGSQRVRHGRAAFTRFVMAFLPRSRRLLISWLQSPSTVSLEPRKIKSVTISMFSHPICHGVMGPDAGDLSLLNVEF